MIFATSFIAMLPWPLITIGICVAGSLLEQDSDPALMLGGLTTIFLLPIGVFDPPNWVFISIAIFVWILVLVIPALIACCWNLTKEHQCLAYILQAGFSIAQAGIGLLMLLGRNV